MVPHLIRKIDKILIEIGLYGSVWVDIEGIRSHGGYRGSGIAESDLVCYIIFNYCLDRGRGIIFMGKHMFCMDWRSVAGVKNLSWTHGSILNMFP